MIYDLLVDLKNFDGFADKYLQEKNSDKYWDECMEEPLNYTLITDFAHYYENQVKAENHDEIERVHDLLLKLYEKNDEIRALVTVGFLEAIKPEDEIYIKIKQILPVKLRKALLNVENFWNGKQTENTYNKNKIKEEFAQHSPNLLAYSNGVINSKTIANYYVKQIEDRNLLEIKIMNKLFSEYNNRGGYHISFVLRSIFDIFAKSKTTYEMVRKYISPELLRELKRSRCFEESYEKLRNESRD